MNGGKIYFHSAVSGHKIDVVRKREKASFCVIGQDHILPEKFTTCYRSVIVFGTVRILEDGQEIRKAMERLCMIEFSITHLTGKQGMECINILWTDKCIDGKAERRKRWKKRTVF